MPQDNTPFVCSRCTDGTAGQLLAAAADRLGVYTPAIRVRLEEMHRDGLEKIWLHRQWEDLLDIELNELLYDFAGSPVDSNWFELRAWMRFTLDLFYRDTTGQTVERPATQTEPERIGGVDL